jgi:hypothetical protein
MRYWCSLLKLLRFEFEAQPQSYSSEARLPSCKKMAAARPAYSAILWLRRVTLGGFSEKEQFINEVNMSFRSSFDVCVPPS